MANKIALDYAKAKELIDAWKSKNTPEMNGRYTYNQLIELDKAICGYLCEAKQGEGIYYSHHTINWVLKQIDPSTKYNYETLGFGNDTNKFALGAIIKAEFTSSLLPECINPEFRAVRDRKMGAALPIENYLEKHGRPAGNKTPYTLDAASIEYGMQRAIVKAIAKNTGLGDLCWLKPNYVEAQMRDAHNGYAPIAAAELLAGTPADAIVDETTGTETIKTSNKTTTKKSKAKVVEITPPAEAPAPVDSVVPPVNQAPTIEAPAPQAPTPPVQTNNLTIDLSLPQGTNVINPTQPTAPTQAPAPQAPATNLNTAFNINKAKADLAELSSNNETRETTISVLTAYFNQVKGTPIPNLGLLEEADYVALSNKLVELNVVPAGTMLGK